MSGYITRMKGRPLDDTNKPLWAQRYYNGFSPKERDAYGRLQYAAAKRGTLAQLTACHACGLDDGIILKHLEDYAAWRDYWPTCLACHKALHDRYRDPAMFEAWTAMVADGYQPMPFESYNWRRWNHLYRYTPPERWKLRRTVTKPNLTLLSNLPVDYTDHVPPMFHVTAGAPILSGQHHGSAEAHTASR